MPFLLDLSVYYIISVPVRLAGTGSSGAEGYVEAFNVTIGQWGGICNNAFDIFDAHVVCNMLGYATAIEALSNGAAADIFGTAPSGSYFTLDNLNCDGSETTVFKCPISTELAKICDASQIAGVRCATSKP